MRFFSFFARVPIATEFTKHCQVWGICIGGSVWRAFMPDCAVVFIIIVRNSRAPLDLRSRETRSCRRVLRSTMEHRCAQDIGSRCPSGLGGGRVGGPVPVRVPVPVPVLHSVGSSPPGPLRSFWFWWRATWLGPPPGPVAWPRSVPVPVPGPVSAPAPAQTVCCLHHVSDRIN